MTEAIYLEISSSIYGSHTFSSLLNNLQDTMLATMQDIKYQDFYDVSTTRINVPKIIKITETNFRTFGVVGDFSFVPNSHFDKYISPITNNIAYTSILAFAQTEYIISGLLYCRLSLNIKKKPNLLDDDTYSNTMAEYIHIPVAQVKSFQFLLQ